MYKYILDRAGQNRIDAILRNDGWTIPFDPANSDYQEYLKWLEAGNTPLPPDAQPE